MQSIKNCVDLISEGAKLSKFLPPLFHEELFHFYMDIFLSQTLRFIYMLPYPTGSVETRGVEGQLPSYILVDVDAF